MKWITKAFEEEIDYLEKRKNGLINSLITPWYTINKSCMDGVEWNTITTIAAMSGGGKTAFLNQMISETHDLNPHDDIVILVFSMEMPARMLIARTISNKLKLTVNELNTKLTSEQLIKIKNEVYNHYKSKKIIYEEELGTVSMMEEKINKVSNKFPLSKIIVMYDHSLLVKKETSYSERETLIQLYNTFNTLKKQIPYIQFWILSQMNRDIEALDRRDIRKPTFHYPTKADIFGSDSAFQTSDQVIALHNPFSLGLPIYGARKLRTEGYIFMHLLKIREGNPNAIAILLNTLKHNKLPEITGKDLQNYLSQ